MRRLWRIEWRKVSRNKAFIIIMGLYVLALLSGAITLGTIEINPTVNGDDLSFSFAKLGVFDFPYIWHNVTYIAGFIKYIIALVVVIFVCNEFSYHTSRQNVIDGLGRSEFMMSKLLLISALTLFSTAVITIITLGLGLTGNVAIAWDTVGMKLDFLLAYTVEVFVYLIFSLFVALLIRRTGFTIIALMLYTMILEPIVAWKFSDSFGDYLPLATIGDLIQLPFKRYVKDIIDVDIQESVNMLVLGRSLIYGAILYLLANLRFKRLDL